jgi:surface antigen
MGRISARALPAFACVTLLSGCAGGIDLGKIEADRSMVTSAVPAGTADREAASDEATIRNAVSSANLETLMGAPIPWANRDTGSRGAITAVTEYRDENRLCRRFAASRESFEGVRLYNGDACLHGNGFWWMREFKAS